MNIATPPDRIGIAFIGAGAVSQWHAAAVRAASPVAQLVGLFDADHARAARAAHEYGCEACTDLPQLLADPRVQAVSVLSPLAMHKQHALQAIAARKHVLIEKPVAATLDDVRELAAAAAQSGVVCMPAHNYIYSPAVRSMKSHIDQGAWGKIVSAWIAYTLHHPRPIAQKYPGVLRQIMTHHFYSILFLLGAPRRLVALSTETRDGDDRLGREDEVAVMLEMPNHALVNLFASFAADDHTSSPWTVLYKVLGTSGGGAYSWRDSVILGPGAGLAWRYPEYEQSFVYEVDYFIRRCIVEGAPPLSTMADAVAAQRLIEAAEESIRHGTVVTLDHSESGPERAVDWQIRSQGGLS